MAWCTSWMFFKDVDGIRKKPSDCWGVFRDGPESWIHCTTPGPVWECDQSRGANTGTDVFNNSSNCLDSFLSWATSKTMICCMPDFHWTNMCNISYCGKSSNSFAHPIWSIHPQAGAASSQPATNEGSAVPGGETNVGWRLDVSVWYTLWLLNIAMENGMSIDDFWQFIS